MITIEQEPLRASAQLTGHCDREQEDNLPFIKWEKVDFLSKLL